jgi:hypothetical protein
MVQVWNGLSPVPVRCGDHSPGAIGIKNLRKVLTKVARGQAHVITPARPVRPVGMAIVR